MQNQTVICKMYYNSLDPVNYGGSSVTVAIGNHAPDFNNNKDENPNAGVVTFQAQRAHEFPEFGNVPTEAERSRRGHAPFYPEDLHRLPAVHVTLHDSPQVMRKAVDDDVVATAVSHATPAARQPDTPIVDLLPPIGHALPVADTPIVDLLEVQLNGSRRSNNSSRRSSVHWEDGGMPGRENGAVTRDSETGDIMGDAEMLMARGVTFRAQTSLIGRQNEGFTPEETSLKSYTGTWSSRSSTQILIPIFCS